MSVESAEDDNCDEKTKKSDYITQNVTFRMWYGFITFNKRMPLELTSDSCKVNHSNLYLFMDIHG